MRLSIGKMPALAVMIAVPLLVSACGSTTSTSPAAKSSATVPKVFGVNVDIKHPNVAGQHITVAISAAPQVSDTVLYLTTEILDAWGASVKRVNLTGDTQASQTILAGDADFGGLALATTVNAGLVEFGPNQPHVDYFMMAAPSIKTVPQLVGHQFAVSNTGGIEAAMYRIILSQYHIPTSKVPLILSGGSSVRTQALLAHQVSAAFVSSDNYLTIKQAGGGFNVLAVVGKKVPFLADSFLAGSPSWVASNPKTVEAVDEAWLEAAKIFNTNEAAWAKAAVAYAGSAADPSSLSQEYQILKEADCWDPSPSSFSPSVVTQNEQVETQTGSIQVKKALPAFTEFSSWKEAQNLFKGQ